MKVLDLSIALTGPYAAALLADQGADVIKVERPGIGDIARWIWHLVDAEAEWVTGAVISVDGGRVLGPPGV